MYFWFWSIHSLYLIHASFFLSSAYLVWPKAPEGTHTDGTAGGTFIFLHPLGHSLCHSSLIFELLFLLLCFRCTWRNPALTSSGPKRLLGECSYVFSKMFAVLKRSCVHIWAKYNMNQCIYLLLLRENIKLINFSSFTKCYLIYNIYCHL